MLDDILPAYPQEYLDLAQAAGGGDIAAASELSAKSREMDALAIQPGPLLIAACEAAKNGHTEVIRALLSQADQRLWGSDAMRYAAANGHLEIVEMLFPVSVREKFGKTALQHAAAKGHAPVVEFLIRTASARDRDDALIEAATSGKMDAARLLLPVSDPEHQSCLALRRAVENGQIDMVKLLLPKSDPKILSSRPLWLSARYGHLEIFKLLLPLSDPCAGSDAALLEAAELGRTEMVKILFDEVYLPELMSGRKSLGEDEGLLGRTLRAFGLKKNIRHAIISAIITAGQNDHFDVVDTLLPAVRGIRDADAGAFGDRPNAATLAHIRTHFDAAELKRVSESTLSDTGQGNIAASTSSSEVMPSHTADRPPRM